MTPLVKGCVPDMPYDVHSTRLPIFALFDLKGTPDALTQWSDALPPMPPEPNTLTRSEDGAELLHIGPGKYLLRADIGQEDALQKTLRPEEAPPEVSITRVSDTLTFFRITGSDAAQVAAIGCPLDLHESNFGGNAVTYSEFFGIKALVLRCEGGFDIAVEQSFGDMIADYLERAVA